MNKNLIIIADDTEPLRRLQKRILQKFSEFKIEEFDSGTSLRNRLEDNVDSIALVITDNDMPGMKGSEIIREYSKRQGFEEIPFILHYAGDEQIGKQAVIDGAFDYLMKPGNVSDYTRLIERALSRFKR